MSYRKESKYCIELGPSTATETGPIYVLVVLRTSLTVNSIVAFW